MTYRTFGTWDPFEKRRYCFADDEDKAGGAGAGGGTSDPPKDDKAAGDPPKDDEEAKKKAEQVKVAEAAKKAREREASKARLQMLEDLGLKDEKEYEDLKKARAEETAKKKNEGRTDEEKYRLRAEEAEKKAEQAENRLREEKLSRRVESEAVRQGCQDPELVSILYAKHLNEASKADLLDTEEFVEELQKKRPHLFKAVEKKDPPTTGPKDKDKDGKSSTAGKNGVKRVQDMSTAERQQHFKTIRSGA